MNEYTWPQFQKLNHIKDLSLQEQEKRYRFYLDELSNFKLNFAAGAEPFLLQENKYRLLLENGFRIKL